MMEFVALPLVLALALGAWPTIWSFRAGRPFQGVLVLFACAIAPFVALMAAVMAMSDALYRSNMPFGVIPVVFLACWAAALATPIVCTLALWSLGMFKPLTATPNAQWRTPDA